MQASVLSLVGAGAFGLVIGWIAYRTLRRAQEPRIADIVTVVAALGGGTVINTQFADPDLFASYGLGLAAGFFGYFVTGALFDRSERKAELAAARERTAAGQQPPVEVPQSGRTSGWMGG